MYVGNICFIGEEREKKTSAVAFLSYNTEMTPKAVI